MILSVKLFDHVYNFSSLKEVMAKANERKSGDALAGIAASSSKERVAAKVVLSKITLKDLKIDFYYTRIYVDIDSKIFLG